MGGVGGTIIIAFARGLSLRKVSREDTSCIEIANDGAGIDRRGLRRQVGACCASDAAALDDQGLLDLVFLGGITATAGIFCCGGGWLPAELGCLFHFHHT